MFTELERQVIEAHKIHNFGAYLQHSYFVYPAMQEEVVEGVLPQRLRLEEMHVDMNQNRIEFNETYLYSLPLQPANPLVVEQQAWRLLSPRVRNHTDEFGDYIKGYSPETAQYEQLLGQLNTGWGLILKWNVISQSFKGKQYGGVENVLAEREQAVRDLIEELLLK